MRPPGCGESRILVNVRAVKLFDSLRTFARESDTIRRWREERYRMFVELVDLRPTDRIVDVGAGWGAALERFKDVNAIVALALAPDPASPWLSTPNVIVVRGDATRMPFDDGEFDVAFSNSVIEHVPPELQSSFAAEVARVAKRYFVQTPNRYFPIEPHYQLPLFQFL